MGVWKASGIGTVRLQRSVKLCKYTVLLEIIIGVLKTRHTQYTSDYRVDVCRITKGAHIEDL